MLPSTPIRLSPSKQTSSVESATTGANSSVSPEMSCTPAKLPRRAEDVEVSSYEGDDVKQSLETSGVSQEDKEGALHYQGVMEEERERLTGTCNTWSEVIEQEDLTEEGQSHMDIQFIVNILILMKCLGQGFPLKKYKSLIK